MAIKGIPPFAIHSFVMTEPESEMLLCEHEFTVLVFAASRVSAESVNAEFSRLTGMAKWSESGKNQFWGRFGAALNCPD
jgi:hypothetical protein